MLRFAVYKDGKLADSVDLSGAHLIGSDGVPLRADIRFAEGHVVCQKKTAGPAGLALLWPTSTGGRMLAETTRLTERDKPYVLQTELLRGRLMRLAQKREDWGLYDFEGVDEIARQIDAARDLLIASLQADTPAAAATVAEKGINVGLFAAEGLTAFHAEIFLNRRKQIGGIPQRFLGCTVDVNCTDPAYRDSLAGVCDYVSLPFSWRHIEPKEQEYAWAKLDNWVDWATKNRIPIRGTGLVNFTESHVPDWLYIWEHDFETIRELVGEHIRRVLRRYGQYVGAWEVISGIHAESCFSLNFEQIMELTRASTNTAKQLAPRSTVIVDLVAPWGEYYAGNQRTIPPMLYAEMVSQSGANFDAFGIQCYLGVGVCGMYVRDLFQISSMLDRFAVLGKPLHVTGIQVPSVSTPDTGDAWEGLYPPSSGGAWHKEWSEDLQRAWIRRVYHIALSKPYVESITWRDLSDAPGHYLPHGGLVRADGSKKPAYEEIAFLRNDLGGERKSAPATL